MAASAATNGSAAPEKVASKSAVSMMALAPADEYFGPLKMSILGIRNTIKDLGLRYDVNHDIGKQTVISAVLTERAIRDWESKYPRDGQIPRSIYFLQRLYAKVLTQESRLKAKVTAQWLFGSYAKSPQAKLLKKIIAVEVLPPIPPDAPAVVAPPPDQFAPFTLNGSGKPAAPANGAPANAAPANGAPPSAAPAPQPAATSPAKTSAQK